ncbi:unnamed protein product [Camellia sinensis]
MSTDLQKMHGEHAFQHQFHLADEVETNNEEVINAIMQDVDTDKDERISHEEFASMMKAGTDWRKASRQYSRETKSYSGKVVPGVMNIATAKHLSHAYGTLAERVAAIAQ